MTYDILPYNATYGYGQAEEEDQQWKEIAPMALAALAGNYAPSSSDDIKRAEQALNVLKSVQRTLPNISVLNNAVDTLQDQVDRAKELYQADLRREQWFNYLMATIGISVVVIAASAWKAAGRR